MIEIAFKWGNRQPNWVTNASQYARNELGLRGEEERDWLQSTLGYTTRHTDEAIFMVFERDSDYTAAVLKWA